MICPDPSQVIHIFHNHTRTQPPLKYEEGKRKMWGVRVLLLPECISPPHGGMHMHRVLLKVLRLRPPFLPIRSNLKETLFCLELEGLLGCSTGWPLRASFPLTSFTQSHTGIVTAQKICKNEPVYMNRSFVKGVKAETPIFTNQTKSPKNSLLS